MLAYLDDWLFLHSSINGARVMIDKVLEDCRKAHVRINHEKSRLVPSRQLEKHLGFTLDFAGSGTITVPEDRWNRLRQDIETLLRAAELHRNVHVRLVASATGQIISMNLAISDGNRLFTRSLYRDIDSAPSWNSHVQLSTESVKELHFWSKTDRTQFTGDIYPVTDKGEAIHLASDASNIGWGGLRLDGPAPFRARGFFLPDERAESSTHREARATLLLLRSF